MAHSQIRLLPSKDMNMALFAPRVHGPGAEFERNTPHDTIIPGADSKAASIGFREMTDAAEPAGDRNFEHAHIRLNHQRTAPVKPDVPVILDHGAMGIPLEQANQLPLADTDPLRDFLHR